MSGGVVDGGEHARRADIRNEPCWRLFGIKGLDRPHQENKVIMIVAQECNIAVSSEN